MDLCQVAWGVAILLFLALAVLARAVRILSDYEGAVFLIWPGKKYRVIKKYSGEIDSSSVPISTIVSPHQPTPQDAAKKRDERERGKILKKIRKMIGQSEGRIRDQLTELQAAILTNPNGSIGGLNGVFQAAEKIFRSEREPRSRKKQEPRTPAKSELTVQDYVAITFNTRHTIDEEVFTQILPALPLEIPHRLAIKAILAEYLRPEGQVFFHQSIRISEDWIERTARNAGVAPKVCQEVVRWFIRVGVLKERKLKGRTAEGGWLDFNHNPEETPFETGKMIIVTCNDAIRQIVGAGGRIKENLLPPL